MFKILVKISQFFKNLLWSLNDSSMTWGMTSVWHDFRYDLNPSLTWFQPWNDLSLMILNSLSDLGPVRQFWTLFFFWSFLFMNILQMRQRWKIWANLGHIMLDKESITDVEIVVTLLQPSEKRLSAPVFFELNFNIQPMNLMQFYTHQIISILS